MSHYLVRLTERQADEQRRRVCLRKRRYLSRWGAVEAIRSVGDETLAAYRCEHCAGWHVGHMPGSVAP